METGIAEGIGRREASGGEGPGERPLSERAAAQERLAARVSAYYTKYYRDVLGLPDWQARVANRLPEDENILPRLRQVETWMNERLECGLRVLVVGGGTGAEFMALARRGCDVFAVEPDPEAVAIARERARLAGADPGRFLCGVAESLPFPDDRFDFVCCHSVIEHVQDVGRSVAEMVRVVKPRGRIFLSSEDYRQCWENHYKLPLPMFAPRWVAKLLLRHWRRNPKFLDSLRLVDSRQLTNIFMEHPVVAMRVIQSWPREWKASLTIPMRLVKWIVRHREIQRDQTWILLKLEKPR